MNNRTLYLALVVVLASPVSRGAEDGRIDSYCMIFQGGSLADYIWKLDNDTAAQMNDEWETNVSQLKLIDHFDGLLQSFNVQQRPRMRHRMNGSTSINCVPGSDACINFVTDADPQCNGIGVWTVAATNAR